MLLIVLTTLLMAIPLYSSTITPTLLTRITSITLLFSAAISFNGLYLQGIGYGLGLYSGLFHVTTVTQTMEVFLFVVGAFILLGYRSEKGFNASTMQNIKIYKQNNSSESQSTSDSAVATPSQMSTALGNTSTPSISEYPLIILFTTIGATFLISSSDLVSMYLSIELQSFAVYILAAIYRNSESATSAGLKYFLLGALSSALILLGSSIIYAYTGLTSLEGIYMMTNVTGDVENTKENVVILGVLIIVVGLLFKVAAAPFHNWAPDVYDGVPTIVTTWLTVMPKISIFVFLLELVALGSSAETIVQQSEYLITMNENVLKTLLLSTSLLSLIIGTVVGLAQSRLKRLLAYSTISHVGFLLLALAVNSEDSISGFLFYLMQYSITNLNAFFVVLAFGYIITGINGTNDSNYKSVHNHQQITISDRNKTDITFISQLKGQFKGNPALSLSLALCLFSMAGIPPLVGFFAKYFVLYSAIENGYYFLALVGILASVVSASYYLRIIRVVFMDVSSSTKTNTYISGNMSINSNTHISLQPKLDTLTSTHSYIIAVLTLFITLFLLSPSLFLNSSNLLALSLFTA